MIEVTLPPLRERPEDLRELAQTLGREAAARMGVSDAGLNQPGFFEELSRHDWPGNVRELRNYLERALVLGTLPDTDDASPPVDGEVVEASPSSESPIKYRDARGKAMAAFERAYLSKLLADHDGSVTTGAKAAGVDRVQFYRLLWRNGMRRGTPDST